MFARYDVGAGTPIYSDYNNYYTVGTANWRIAVSPGAYSTTIYNLLGAWNTATGFDLNSIISNPQLINAGGTNSSDYKLQAGSPALTGGRGGSYASVMGAYITGDEIIGYVAPVFLPAPDTTPPSAPTGLVVM